MHILPSIPLSLPYDPLLVDHKTHLLVQQHPIVHLCQPMEKFLWMKSCTVSIILLIETLLQYLHFMWKPHVLILSYFTKSMCSPGQKPIMAHVKPITSRKCHGLVTTKLYWEALEVAEWVMIWGVTTYGSKAQWLIYTV
jgi:hypothetical protein